MDILHEGAQVKFFLTEVGKERELDDAFTCFLKPLLQARLERSGAPRQPTTSSPSSASLSSSADRLERERLLAAELKSWELELDSSGEKQLDLEREWKQGSAGVDVHRAQTWDEGAVRKRLVERYGVARRGGGNTNHSNKDEDLGLGDIAQLEGALMNQLTPERRAWVRGGARATMVGESRIAASTSSSPDSGSSSWSSCPTSLSSSCFLSDSSTRGTPPTSTSLPPLSVSTGNLRANDVSRKTSYTRDRREELKQGAELRRSKSLDIHDVDDSSQEDLVPIDSDGDDDDVDRRMSGHRGSLAPSPTEKRNSAAAAGATRASPFYVADEIVAVLTSLSLTRYVNSFARAEGTPPLNLQSFLQLDDDELKRLNLPFGARKKIRTWQKKYTAQQQVSPVPMRRSDGESKGATGLIGRSKSTTVNISGKEGSPEHSPKEASSQQQPKRSFSHGISQLKKKFSTIGPSAAASAATAEPTAGAESGKESEDKHESPEKPSPSRSLFSRKYGPTSPRGAFSILIIVHTHTHTQAQHFHAWAPGVYR